MVFVKMLNKLTSLVSKFNCNYESSTTAEYCAKWKTLLLFCYIREMFDDLMKNKKKRCSR